jgi:ElaB/YqjD/DUF883 family membrane-anchored ribosome-binding protein
MPKPESKAMANEETSKFSDEISGLRAEFARVADTVSEFVKTRGAEAAAKIQDTAGEGWAEAKKKIDCVGKKIHEEPVTSAAIAFGVGLLIGLIFSNRRR